jgi:hypothetical protein
MQVLLREYAGLGQPEAGGEAEGGGEP